MAVAVTSHQPEPGFFTPSGERDREAVAALGFPPAAGWEVAGMGAWLLPWGKKKKRQE